MFDYTKDNGQIGVMRGPLPPHPDGKAWPKCCRDGKIADESVDCAFIRDQCGGARLTKGMTARMSVYSGSGTVVIRETPFMCCHRSTDDGYYRVCAGWDACFGNKSLAAHD